MTASFPVSIERARVARVAPIAHRAHIAHRDRPRSTSISRARTFCRAAFCVLAVIGCAPLFGEESVRDLFKKTAPAIVTVIAYNPDRAMPSLGTGFFVAPDRIATARHVFAGANRAEARTANGTTLRIGGIVAEDPPRDLVIVELAQPRLEGATLKMAAANPEPGERVFTVSSPFGLEWTVSEGVVSSVRITPSAGPSIQHTAPVSPGSSGCPILNFAGEVVAVQTGTITTGDGIVQAGQSLNFATPCEAIAAMQPGKAKGLEEGAREIPAGWVPPITREIDLLSLRPFTRDDFAATLPFFEESVIREPKEADAWFRLGLCRDRLGNLDGAMEAYAKAVELKGDFAVAQNNYGIGHLRRKDPAKAAEALRAAVRAKPSYVEAQSSLAGVLVDLREYKEAAEAAEAAVKLNPGYAEAHLHLGAALFYLGEIEKAAAEHEVLQRLDRNLGARLKLILETVWS